jgi:hypothetical protein
MGDAAIEEMQRAFCRFSVPNGVSTEGFASEGGFLMLFGMIIYWK